MPPSSKINPKDAFVSEFYENFEEASVVYDTIFSPNFSLQDVSNLLKSLKPITISQFRFFNKYRAKKRKKANQLSVNVWGHVIDYCFFGGNPIFLTVV